MDIRDTLSAFGIDTATLPEGDHVVRSPIDGSELVRLPAAAPEDVDAAVERARAAFAAWRRVPPPRRGELVRLLGEELRAAKGTLGRLVSIEAGKILSEGQGEVQEMIDICDFAVGLSRQLHGLTIASERPDHRMSETWHPLGPIGVITAFNFPVAVWSWNTAIALVCGDPVVWKPSDKTPLTALACQALLRRAAARMEEGEVPPGLLEVLVGGAGVGERLADSQHLPLISATGSVAMGKAVGPRVTGRLGRVLLELGGNNAAIVAPSADLELTARAVVFSAAGTAGQRCTTLRRLIVHESVRERLVDRLVRAYASLPVGDPLDPDTLVGPLIDARAADAMDAALEQARAEGGEVLVGGEPVTEGVPAGGIYRRPAIVAMPEQSAIVRTETFAPILYVTGYEDFADAIDLHNGVPQGLSSSLFSTDVRETETFLSAVGSDCGIANVNIGPSGAEIGGAFGGEKETGGGRESGSDAWKAYMRRQTQTVNYGTALPLAQGVRFDIAE
ncbi:MAG: aldehyde dehydrogenase family protein [Azospirillaceae bacterium]